MSTEAALRGIQATIVALGVLIILAVAAVAFLPRAFGWTTLVVLSGSMEPAMPVGGLAFVEPVEPKDVQEGDVVTFPRPGVHGALVSHRVLVISDQLGGPTLWTKGDANETPDAWAIRDDEVIGRVRFALPYLGTASRELRTPRGFFALIALPGVAIILTELAQIVAALRRPRAVPE
jgi:signal peptidase